MISKAQDMNNNIFIVPGVLNNDFNEFLRFYFKIYKKRLNIKKTQKVFWPQLDAHKTDLAHTLHGKN